MAGSGYPIMSEGPSMVTATLGDNDPAVGTLKRFPTGLYRFVYNAGNSQISPGYGAVVSAVSGYSVTVSSIANQIGGGIGVCQHATLTTGTYGWLLVEGFASYEADADRAVTAGDGLALAADGVWVKVSGATGFSGSIYAKAMVATASGGSATGYFNFAGV